MPLFDKIMLRKRYIFEPSMINNFFYMNKQSRHRSFHKFLNRILAGLIAYSILPKKLAVKMYDYQLANSS